MRAELAQVRRQAVAFQVGQDGGGAGTGLHRVGRGGGQRLVGRHQHRHDGAYAGAAHTVHLDAVLHQGAVDAELRQAARAAPGQHQAHGGAGLQAGQARHVAR